MFTIEETKKISQEINNKFPEFKMTFLKTFLGFRRLGKNIESETYVCQVRPYTFLFLIKAGDTVELIRLCFKKAPSTS